MKLSFATRAFPLMVTFGILSVACGGSSSETPMPLEPVPHSGPSPEFPPEEDEDPPNAPESTPLAPAQPLAPVGESLEPEPLPPATTEVEPEPQTPPPPAAEPAPPAPPLN